LIAVVAGATVERDRTATFRSALRWTLGLAGVAFLVLLVTGLYLMWRYRPSEALLWSNVTGSAPDSFPRTITDIHHVASLLSGSLLAWDQLARRAVTVGTSFQGFWKIDSGNVRYVLVDGHEISGETLLRWFWVDTTVLPVAPIGLAALLVLTTRSRPRQSPDN
jgi:quinol-cytochrome oxidoreductase complex cytochrome b subunit